MVQLTTASSRSRFGGGADIHPQGNHYFQKLQQQAQSCGCPQHRQYFEENRQDIRQRCSARHPGACRHDEQGQRWENGCPAQTQITQQNDSCATLIAGNNKLTFNKADKSMRIQNADGTEQSVDLKLFEDPHVQSKGRDLGTLKNDVAFTLKDGTQVKVLMGDGHGGAPKPGAPDYVDTVAVRSPDGTGALVTGISGPSPLSATPLDSSYASEFMARQALNRFGHYEPSRVSVDSRGNMIDQSNGQVIHDQNGLDHLDQEQARREAAHSLYQQGYTPQDLADRYDRPFDRYDDRMRQDCESGLARLLQRLQEMQPLFENFANQYLSLARHSGGFGRTFPLHGQSA